MTFHNEDALNAAETAIEEGLAAEALEILAACDRDDPERALLATLAFIDIGQLADAGRELHVARAGLAADDALLHWVEAELALAEWRIGDARGFLERLVEDEANLTALERLALCLDLAEDFDGADRLLARAHALDPKEAPLPPRLSAEEFDAVVDEVLRNLPRAFKGALENTRIVIEPMPFAALVLPSDPGLTPPDILGLFTGSSQLERSDEDLELPPAIYLFQRNLERFSRDTLDLREQIRITLYHEIAHRLGFEEEGVDAMGLG